MLSDKQIQGLRKWFCTECHIGLGYVGEGMLTLREGKSKVVIDVHGASQVERRCNRCGTTNQLKSILKHVPTKP